MAGTDSKFRSNLSGLGSLRVCVAIALAVFAFAGLAAVHAQTRTITTTTTTTTHTYSRSSSFQFNIEEESSGPSCSSGYGLCDGKCVPIGSVCCRGGGYCPHANICTQDGKCLPPNSPRACGGGTYCAPGYLCGPGNSCVSEALTEKVRQAEQAVRDIERKMDEEQREKAAADKREAEKFDTASNRMMREFAERQRTETAPSSGVAPLPPGQSHIKTGLPGLPGVTQLPPSSPPQTGTPHLAEPGLPRPPATGSSRLASRDTTSNGTVTPTPAPSPSVGVVIQGMQTGPGNGGGTAYNNNGGSCSTITGPGMGGGGPANCGNGNTSQFPGPSGMSAAGTYSKKAYQNSSGWKFNPNNGLWQNPANPNQTSIPTFIYCCDDTGLGFPGDAINPPQDNAAPHGTDGCALAPARIKQLLRFMDDVAKRTNSYPKEIADSILRVGGPKCGVPSNLNCLRAFAGNRPAPFGCPTYRYDNTDQQADAGRSGAEPAPVPQPSPSIADSGSPMNDDDEAYCNYMASAIVRGELTRGPATAIPQGCKATIAAAEALRARQIAAGAPPPFTMDPAQTDEAIRRLLGASVN